MEFAKSGADPGLSALLHHPLPRLHLLGPQFRIERLHYVERYRIQTFERLKGLRLSIDGPLKRFDVAVHLANCSPEPSNHQPAADSGDTEN